MATRGKMPKEFGVKSYCFPAATTCAFVASPLASFVGAIVPRFWSEAEREAETLEVGKPPENGALVVAGVGFPAFMDADWLEATLFDELAGLASGAVDFHAPCPDAAGRTVPAFIVADGGRDGELSRAGKTFHASSATATNETQLSEIRILLCTEGGVVKWLIAGGQIENEKNHSSSRKRFR